MAPKKGRNNQVWAYRSKRSGHWEACSDGQKLFPDEANYPLEARSMVARLFRAITPTLTLC